MIDFEQELYNRFGQIKDFTLGMRIAEYFYELGETRMKEQMMKNAAEGIVHYFGETQGVPRSITIPQMQKWLKPFGNDDKVKLIIIKEDAK